MVASPLPDAASPADSTSLQAEIRRYLSLSSCEDRADDRPQVARAVMMVVRDILARRLFATESRYRKAHAKRIYYLSMEYHLGRALSNALDNLGLTQEFSAALKPLGHDLDEIVELDADGALGNGGMARLAACFPHSLATLEMPGFGYGLNYQFGLFRQRFVNGYQQELPGQWDIAHNPWLIHRPDKQYRVPLYGRVETSLDQHNRYTVSWTDQRLVTSIRHDLPLPGYNTDTVNGIRLFSARADNYFDIPVLSASDYSQAIRHQLHAESISKMLYPTDMDGQSLEARLKQEYFLVACTIQDIMTEFHGDGHELEMLADKCAIQLNDTNPSLTIAELMRYLVDERQLPWDNSWELTRKVCGYTNNTLVPEALEKWPVQLVERVLPRHLQIIYEINHRFLDEVRLRFPDDENGPTRMSLIEETGGRQLNMSHLAIVGSHAVNGVALMHSQLLRTSLFPDFARMFPERFTNMTNGVTQRRWLRTANPALARLITATIGDSWLTRAEEALPELERFADDAHFQNEFAACRSVNKQRLAAHVLATVGEQLDPLSLFDVQIKRVREYKRQVLHLLAIIHIYLAIVEDGQWPQVPTTHIFAGKADPGDTFGKLTIKLINNLAQVINRDHRIKGMIKVIMLPDFTVSLAEKIIPAADLGEQISTAGTEASGTGLMKLALNGALTLGTLDGANIELMDAVGHDNVFIFGLNGGQIEEMCEDNSYSAWDHYADNPAIRRAVDCLDSDIFCQEEPGLFKHLFSSLMYEGDQYFHLADFEDYLKARQRAENLYTDPAGWYRAAIYNIARAGRFSADRTIREYGANIWNVRPVPNIETT